MGLPSASMFSCAVLSSIKGCRFQLWPMFGIDGSFRIGQECGEPFSFAAFSRTSKEKLKAFCQQCSGANRLRQMNEEL